MLLGSSEGELKKTRILIIWPFVLMCLFLHACRLLQPLNPTPSFAPAIKSLVPNTPVLEPTITEATIAMNCDDEVLIARGDYRVENNTWGKGNLSGWSQCIGIGPGAGGAIAARWTWDWLISGYNVKGYPEIIFGQKPGGTTTTEALPVRLSDIDLLTVSYDVISNYSGSGNVAFDIWLTDTSNPMTFGVPPITHEIMVWIDHQGAIAPGGNFKERVNFDDIAYAVYVAPQWGEGWKYVAFFSQKSQLEATTFDLGIFLAYMKARSLVTGAEYLASIEFGNEVATGSGETIVQSYSVALTKK
jgi:hypothetical protein